MSNVISPGNVAVHHEAGCCNTKVMDKRVKVAELVLRLFILAFGVVALSLIVSDSQVKVIFTLTKKAYFTDIKALVFLVIVDGMIAAYSFVQMVRCVVWIVNGSVLFSKPLAWLIFSADQVMAYLSLTAVAVAAESGLIGKYGQEELQWMKTCDLYAKFCNQIGQGLASSVVASVCTVILSGVSAYSLFRLYGGSKNKSSFTW